MKKLITLLLAVAGYVSTASATDYWVGGNFNSGDDNWTTQQMSENGDGTYSLFVNLNAKKLYFTIFTGSKINWHTNSYKPVSSGPWITNSVQEISVLYSSDEGYNSTNDNIIYPTTESGDNWNAASAIRIDFNPSTKKVSVSRFISVPNGYNGWSTTADYITETTFGSKIYSGNVTLQADTDGKDDGFKFYCINTSAEYVGKDTSNKLTESGNNYDVAVDGVYTLTADFTTRDWADPVLVNVTASVGTYGMATLSSEYALDFTGIENVKAYTITASDKSTGELTKSQVTSKVPANTGLYIEGDANASVDVPTTIYTTSAGTNRLVPGTGATINQVDGTNTNYILTVNKADGTTAETPKFFKVNTDGNTVPAGKAYLQIPTASAAREFFWFGEDATAIDAVEQNAAVDGQAYNLAGLRVAQPTKGLYIVNGKKVIMK